MKAPRKRSLFPSHAKPPPLAPPRGLEALTFEVNGEDLVLFRFPVRQSRPPLNLSIAERAVVAGVLAGMSNLDIAAARGASVNTVRNQLAAIFRKLGVRSRWELIRLCGDS